MAVFPQKPRSGQKVLQGLYNSVCQIIDYLPSLEVRGDNSSTSVTKTSNGTIVHSNTGFDSIEDLRARYRFHNGIMAEDNKIYIRSTLTGGRFITVDYYEQNEQGEEVELDYPLINCTLSAGNNIEITPNGVINCTLTGGGGGGGGNTYYADNFTLSTTISGGNTFCLYDVYPLITGGGGTTVSRYGDAPGYPGHALGTIISSPNYIGESGIAILDDTTPGTYNKYVAITADFDYHAGTGISIDPDTRTINCTVEPGGGGTSGLQYPNYSALYNDHNGNVSGIGISWLLPVSAGQEYKYYTDARDENEEQQGTYKEYAFATYAPAEGETGDSRRAIENGVEFVPSANGYIRISVFDDGKHQGKCLRFYKGGDTSYEYATPLYRFHGFTNYEAGAGIAIKSGIITCTLQPGQGLMSTALYDGNSNPYDPNRPITGIAFNLSTQFLNDLSTIYYGRNAVDKVLSSQNGNLVWATNVEPGGGGETYYADETTIKLSSTNNTFYLYDVEPALTGEGDIQIGNYGFDGVRRITSISATPYTGTDGISVQNHVISLTATIPTKTSDLINDSGFITTSNEYKGDGITIAASGTNNNTFYVIDGVFARLSTVTNLSTELSGHIDYVSGAIPLSTSQLVNDVPFITSTWVDDNFISGGATGDHMYYNSQEKLLKCMLTGGTNIEIKDIGNYGYINCTLTGLDQLDNTCGFVTTEQVTSIVPHIPTSGLMSTALYDANDNLTGIEYGLSSKFYSDLTTISTRPATGDRILSSHNGTLSWQTNDAGGGGSVAGFPTYASSEAHDAIIPGTVYSANQDFWLMGTFDLDSSFTGDLMLYIMYHPTPGMTFVYLGKRPYSGDPSVTVFVNVPIPKNRRFYVNGTSADSWRCRLLPYGTTGTTVTLTTYS